MTYEETVIDGVLHWRMAPDAEWTRMSAERLTTIVLALRNPPPAFVWPVAPHPVWPNVQPNYPTYPWSPGITCDGTLQA